MRRMCWQFWICPNSWIPSLDRIHGSKMRGAASDLTDYRNGIEGSFKIQAEFCLLQFQSLKLGTNWNSKQTLPHLSLSLSLSLKVASSAAIGAKRIQTGSDEKAKAAQKLLPVLVDFFG